jgi:glycosyltransferase involved in cell wall biosynthesis
MKRIIFLSVMNGSAWGGSEEPWYQAALWTARHGYDVTVCCFDAEGKINQLRQLENAGCKLLLLPRKEDTKKQPLIGKLKLNKAVADIPFETYDKVIVSQGGWKDIVYRPFKKLYRRFRSYVLIYHSYNVNEKISLRKLLLLQKWADNATCNIGDTLKIFSVLEETYGLHIPNQQKSFNPLTFPAPVAPAPYPAVTGGKYIFSVFAALDIKRKGQDVLVKVFEGKEWRNRNWELHLYGEGKDRKLLEKLISDKQMGSRIILKGYAADYQEAIRQSHLVLQITLIDAMPIVVMDSLSMARPVIISNVGDMPYWVKDGINGWITPEATTEATGLTLEKAWRERDRWPEMGKESYSIFKTDFPADPVLHFIKQMGIPV